MRYVLAFLLLCSCTSKPANPLAGKWKLEATAMSIGGPLTETPADKDHPVYIEFREDGNFTSTEAGNKYHRYVVNHDTVTFTSNQGADPYICHFGIAEQQLKLVPIQPACIEGCYTKYTTAK